MLESGMKSQAVVDVMKRVVPFLRDDIDYDRLLAYRLFMAVHESDDDERKKIAEDLMGQISRMKPGEKIKLIEVSESVEHGSFTGLVQAVQNALLTHLDILTGTWEASLNGSRGKYTDMNWNLSAYCSSTMEYARLYWSLGALEHAMTIYDELDLFLVDIINEMCDVEAGREPRWVVSLRAAGLPFRSLYASFEQAKLDCKKDHGLVAIRHFLLAQQLLLSLHLYNSRHRSRGAAPSMRVDFAALVLRYAKHVLNTAMRQSRIALMNVSPACLACWSLVVSGEALHIAGLLADPSTVDGAAASMLELSDVVEAEQSKTRDALLEWLSVEDSSGVTEYLREMLQNPNSFAQQLVKAHDAATSTLLQWGRSRQAAHIGWKMAEWMRANDRDAGALPLELRFITSMLESGMKSQAVVDVMKRVVPFLRDDIDYDRLLAYRLFMAVHESDDDERKKIAEDLMGQISRMKPGEKINLTEPPGFPKNLIQAAVGGFTPLVQIPNGRVSMDFLVTSSLPIPIDNFCLRVKLREVDEHVLSRRKQPVYDVQFSERDQICRVVTLHRQHFHSRHKSHSHTHSHSKSPVEAKHTEELLLTCSNQVIAPGRNEITVSAVAKTRGCFIMDRVQATLFDGALTVDIDDVVTRRFVTVFVQSTPNKLWIDDSKDLLAGVVQQVNVTIEAGSSVDCSKIDVRADTTEGIEFMGTDGEWSSNISVDIPPLGVCARHTFELVLCLLMDAGLTASPAIRRAKISFEWLGRVWSVELPFVALLIMTSSTSMLENKTLFELEIARAVGHAEEWTVVLENATIEAIDPKAAEDVPNHLGKLINRDLGELIPNVVASLVWILPLTGELPISHKLSIDYRVKPTKEVESQDGRKNFIDRLYTYREAFDLHVPKVGYELCAQMLSQQPGAQLCRAGAACDLVISLRSL
ncbi:hypothetical protein ANCCEY_11659 [Ancylostoma ceylanicum]|uniref:TRAPPC10/Trs130 N-terminal domain-containing protein n=1 Tax=Ancylostoma ceylanicum TaxID=53326 RepID=A0A0D6LAZ0_9BILA|nr:hypothetical protein ANCCEY_11659 [Ancylostoma ceylanicum]